jgi:hypothetical protein
VPQAVLEVPSRQLVPEQQPGQVLALHVGVPTQVWPEQVCPDTPQSVQAPPPVPQSLSEVPGRQVVPTQQPVAQLAAPQVGTMQAPAVQTWPAGHCASVPQWHCPSAPQVSARVEMQWVQTPPGAMPQYWSEMGVWQVLPVQQPVGQVVALQLLAPAQTPLTQLLGAHFSQVMPPVPQLVLSVRPGRQLVPEQQPAQVVGSQTQAPPTQWLPAAQAVCLVPQRQTPWFEQPSAVSGSQARQRPPLGPQKTNERVLQLRVPEQQPPGQEAELQTQSPPTQAWPTVQAGFVPQAQVPSAAQPFALVPSHGLQVPPTGPQAATVGGAVQVLPEQQPVRHEAESQ